MQTTEAELKVHIAALLHKASSTDEAEKHELDLDIPDEITRRQAQRGQTVSPDKAQDSFTDPESRIMTRAGAGFDYRYDAQTAVDEAAHIIVAAEVVNTSSDVQQLPMVLQAAKAHSELNATQVLADAGYRSEAVMAELAQSLTCTELVIVLGREGKEQAQVPDRQVQGRLQKTQMDC